MASELFEDGDPWDHIVKMTMTLERLIKAHNDLTADFQKVIQKQKILDARMQEMRQIIINEGYSLDRPKRT